jgi:FK506-binding protein 2
MRFFTPLLTLATLLSLTTAIPDGLIIENLTPEITCTRKTKTGDKIDVHYRGTLASDGTQFDASYDRGSPLSFAVGTGRVIKG